MKPKFFIIASRLSFLLFLFCLNCSKGDNDTNTTPYSPPNQSPPYSCSTCLYYGGNQIDAPTLDAGTHQAAARFTPAKIGGLVGKTIKEIHYFILDKPDSIRVKLYGPQDDKTPGNLLYSADVTSASEANKWNIHTLTQSITLKSEDIWLSIEVKLTSSRKTIGCDPGPAVTDGDWLYSSSDGQWTPFNKRTGTSINWTIRINPAS